ncbi:hypothetical protein DAPPUDRAFT_197829 [Daphnia pulex]|uniref:Mannosyltransferase n=1 Tax=Daphnia pulex TaxID=6669 RepID=E9GNG8_DAPPU|nr:hypothetical protein DAPPUDRAFT_197829 [Daphnia pulex]|eukprot:EFX79028.1 hypothetical protein DAPPUDRAFT_197829 [Daphnia pulex]
MWKSNLLCVFLITRLSSVFVVQTWFVPDEYWQSLEVSHRLSFGYGYLTWEWLEGIRSLIYPLFFCIPYKLMAYFSLDDPKALIYVPRILQALFSAWSEWSFIKGIGKLCDKSQVSWFVLLQLGNYFLYYVTSRTLANTLEMGCTLLGISYFLKQHTGSFLLCVIISCYMRPTSAPIWLPFMLCFFQQKKTHIFTKHYLKIYMKCLVVLAAVFGFDSWWYGKVTFVPLQFLLFNVVNDFSKFYGEHSWHWYFTNALPSLMGPSLWFAFFCPRDTLFMCETKTNLYIYFHLFFCSLVGHKEIRFLTPIVPLLNLLAALKLPNLRWQRIFLVLFCLWNIPIMLYLSTRHQRGVLDATDFLRSMITSEDRVLFLMPCHSTPLYSHLHVKAELQFLTCPPNLNHLKNYVDEADKFYDNPTDWFIDNPSLSFTNYFVFFDVLLDSISAHLGFNGFHLIGNFFHADIAQGRVGRHVLVFKKG